MAGVRMPGLSLRDPFYLAWIRTQPCVIGSLHPEERHNCLQCFTRRGRVEAAHTGPHGMAQKSPDRSALPMCHYHHRGGRNAYHVIGARAFERVWDVNLRELVAHFNRKPQVKIEGGSFVAYLDGQDGYRIGRVSQFQMPFNFDKDPWERAKQRRACSIDLGSLIRCVKASCCTDRLADCQIGRERRA